jgi:Transposase DDE domain
MGMQKRPRKSNGRHTPQSGHSRPQVTSPQEDIHGFFAALFGLIAPGRFERLAEHRNSKRGRPPELPLPDLLAALLFHFLCGAGTASEHLFQLLGRRLCDSAIAERRSILPWALWERWLRDALRSTAHRRRHPEAFYRGWRLVAIDGTQYSVSNTPQTSKELVKASSRRAKAAFAKITACVLLEVGLHNPLAAAIAHCGQSEWQLSAQLLAQLAKGCLLLADRLYGCGAFAALALDRCQKVGSHFLIRARSNIKVTVQRRFRDGSRLIEVPVRDRKTRRLLRTIVVREIWGQVHRKGWRSEPLRLWTSLLDPTVAPARELLQLYGRRWEQELYFRQLKLQLRRTSLLQSHTVRTAAQEIALLILASALVAQERVHAAKGVAPVLRVSFAKVLELLRPLWLVLAIAGDLLTEQQQREITERFYDHMVLRLVQEREPRSCQRKVRQPVGKWPRLLKTESWQGPLSFSILRSHI